MGRIGIEGLLTDRASALSFCEAFYRPFTGFTKLQEKVLGSPWFWDHTQDLIIKGVPGSGKTLLAELALFVRPKPEGRARKLLYLLPYRALLNEKYHDFMRRYDLAQYRICRSSSDYNDRDGDILEAECEIAVMIYEKLDNALHATAGGESLFYRYDLIVMDEFSLVSTLDRGLVVHDILRAYRALPAQRDGQQKARILALTVPACATTGYGAYGFETIVCQEKACELFEAIVQADTGCIVPREREEDWPVGYEDLTVAARIDKEREDQRILRECWDLDDRIERSERYEHKELLKYIIKAHRRLGHSILVFCSSRETTRHVCRSLSHMVRAEGIPHGDWSQYLASIEGDMGDNAYGSIDEVMRACARYGVTFHNADLPSSLRLEIEKEFRKKGNSRLDIVVATETLAYGINCCADVVIIYDRIKPTTVDDHPTFPFGHHRYMRYLNPIEYCNFAGRAGRLGYGTGEEGPTGYAYLFAKDPAGERSVRARYYCDRPRKALSCQQLFSIKLRRDPLTTTGIVFDALGPTVGRRWRREDLLAALHELSGKEALLGEEEAADRLLREMQKLQLIEEEDGAFALTRLGEALQGRKVPYEVIRRFKGIRHNLQKGGPAFFLILYELCGASRAADLCPLVRQVERLRAVPGSMRAFIGRLERDGEAGGGGVAKLERAVRQIQEKVERLQPNEQGYAYIEKELADGLHQYFNAAILYLWAQGASIESIHRDYGLPTKLGAITNYSRDILFLWEPLAEYLRAFPDLLPMGEELAKARQSLKYGLPYGCIEALGHKVSLDMRPEICALYAKLGLEGCCMVLRGAASDVDDSSSVSDSKRVRRYLRDQMEEA